MPAKPELTPEQKAKAMEALKKKKAAEAAKKKEEEAAAAAGGGGTPAAEGEKKEGEKTPAAEGEKKPTPPAEGGKKQLTPEQKAKAMEALKKKKAAEAAKKKEEEAAAAGGGGTPAAEGEKKEGEKTPTPTAEGAGGSKKPTPAAEGEKKEGEAATKPATGAAKPGTTSPKPGTAAGAKPGTAKPGTAGAKPGTAGAKPGTAKPGTAKPAAEKKEDEKKKEEEAAAAAEKKKKEEEAAAAGKEEGKGDANAAAAAAGGDSKEGGAEGEGGEGGKKIEKKEGEEAGKLAAEGEGGGEGDEKNKKKEDENDEKEGETKPEKELSEEEKKKKEEEEEKKKKEAEEKKKKEEEEKTKAAAAAASGQPRVRDRKKPIVDTSSRKQMGPLTVDPRSGLPLIEIPRDRQHSFAHLGTDLVLHIFLDVDRITSKGNPVRRTLFVTDQTMFVCEESGAVSRSIPVAALSQVNVSTDSSNGLAFVVPSEYDIIIKPDRKPQRDDLLVVLRAVYRRLTNSELNVHQVKEIKANQYRMDKPAGFQLQSIPQRTVANLRSALEAIEQDELDRAQAIQSVQMQLEAEHKQELDTKKQELRSVQQRLDKATTRLREQVEELEALRSAYGKTKKRVEEIEAQMANSTGGASETLAAKETRIHELEDVVEHLSSAVAKANEERHRVEQLRRRGDFEEFDMDHIDNETTRFRGRSLHQQGLVEVLQRQLAEKRKELSTFQTRTTDIQRLNLELARKEEVLRDYEQLMPSKSRESDPMLLYSDLPGTNIEDMLDRRDRAAPPTHVFGGKEGGMDPVLGLATTVGKQELADDEGEEAHTGVVPQHKVHLQNDLPEYKLPEDDRDFTVDPRTQLKFIDVPPLFQEAFKELSGTILHFFAVASKSNKRGREQKRIMMVSDRVLYQCNTAGHINRCVPVVNIREMQIDNLFNVALIIDGRNEYDMAFRFDNMGTCDEMANVIKRTTTFLRRVPPVKITHVERLIQSDLRLEKPPAWEFRLHPLAPRKALFKALQELSQSTAEQRARIHEQADQQTLELINRLKEEMRPEITMRREREFSVLRQQLTILDNSLREKQAEARLLRRRIADHRCNVDNLKLTNRGNLAQEATETPGMYWIPSDPVIMECQLEILHIAFHDNFVVTSHANGVLNVWDLTTADLFRTLKTNSHTARVQAFHFEAHVLISGGFDGSLRQWSIVEGVCSKNIPAAHRGHITALKFDQTHLITGGSDADVHVWDVSSLKKMKTLQGHKSGVTALSFQRSTLATAEWGWIFIWDVEKGLVNKVLRDDNGGICTIDIQGSTVVTGGTGGVLIVWNLHTNEGEQLEGHSEDVYCVQLQSQFAISSSADGTIRMWNAKDRTSLGVFHNCAPAECKTFHFKANRFVIAEGRTLKCWTR